ncbi:unnamed protein product [Polarella glacialis]|uniref:PPM-type phosphatase domain-containing protein n=2 Tax=Polarella glacialis TaxID=89957 RepID=A0A813L786_POLGL|nr:unnamed protein product [Polarella glacialis]
MLSLPGVPGSGHTTPANSDRSPSPKPKPSLRKTLTPTQLPGSILNPPSPKVNTSHIARPDGPKGWGSARTLTKTLTRDSNGLTREGSLDDRSPASKDPTGMSWHMPSTVAEKEDHLEAIMAADSHASYESLGRLQMNPGYITKSALNPSNLKGKLVEVSKLTSLIDGSDLDDPDDSDDELIESQELKQWHSQPGDMSIMPSEMGDEVRYRMGAALPLSKNAKVSMTAVLGRLASKSNVKASSAFAKGVDLSSERAFAASCGKYRLLGMVNSHGQPKIAGNLTLLVAQEMPSVVFRRGPLVRGEDVVKGLNDAFSKVHAVACSRLDLRHTGASCTLVLMDGVQIWVAHVGDCRAVMGVQDSIGMARDFHFTSVPLTEDHKLCVKKEFDRIRAAGGEMRKLMHDNICRLFVQDAPVPGLALTRGIGFRLAHTVGVIHKPSVCVMRRSDMADGTFILLGSSGVWTNLAEKTAVNWVCRSFADCQAAAMSLSTEALNRWEAPNCQAKGRLREDSMDCFSSMLIEFHSDEPGSCEPDGSRQQPQRNFVIGTPGVTPRRNWDEVKSANRTLELRRMADTRLGIGLLGLKS